MTKYHAAVATAAFVALASAYGAGYIIGSIDTENKQYSLVTMMKLCNNKRREIALDLVIERKAFSLCVHELNEEE